MVSVIYFAIHIGNKCIVRLHQKHILPFLFLYFVNAQHSFSPSQRVIFFPILVPLVFLKNKN